MAKKVYYSLSDFERMMPEVCRCGCRTYEIAWQGTYAVVKCTGCKTVTKLV